MFLHIRKLKADLEDAEIEFSMGSRTRETKFILLKNNSRNKVPVSCLSMFFAPQMLVSCV